MQQRTIGSIQVSAIGLGGMPMSIEGRPDRARSIATIHASLDAGVTLIDTADAYHLHADEVGHNESLIAEALSSYGQNTDDVLVATKGGHLRPGDGSWTIDSSPAHLREAVRPVPPRDHQREDKAMTRRRTPHFWFPVLLLRDALGRFAKIRRHLAPERPRPRLRRPTLPVFFQLELDLT